MRYLFFDIEGANCCNYVSKMCTFGYVIADKYFVKSIKEDVIINPESHFDHMIIKLNMNAYPISTYKHSQPFNYFYVEIKKLLEHEDQIIIGWSVENDVKYIFDACKRYQCPQIRYRYLDLQKVEMIIKNEKNQKSLEKACEEYNISLLTTHKSDDDAEMTMAIAKKMCDNMHISIEELCEKYPECISNVDEYELHALTDEEIEVRLFQRKVSNVIKNYKGKNNKHNSYIHDDDIFAFEHKLMASLKESVISTIKYIKDCGAKCTNLFKDSTIIVCENKEEFAKNYERVASEHKLIEYDELIKNIMVLN